MLGDPPPQALWTEIMRSCHGQWCSGAWNLGHGVICPNLEKIPLDWTNQIKFHNGKFHWTGFSNMDFLGSRVKEVTRDDGEWDHGDETQLR